MHNLSLNGNWRISGIAPDGQQQLTVDGQVPGQVHLDLEREKIIPEMFWRDNAEQCQWIERRDWVYEREFELPAPFDRTWAVLEFGGLDTFATITLNGHELGRTRNMFIPHRFEVGEYLRPGTNHLRVHFDSIGKHVDGKPMDAPCAFENQERLHIRRMQCTFHWDWVNRFVTAGIWQPVSLVSYDQARVSEVGVRCSVVGSRLSEPEAAEVFVELETELRTNNPVTAKIEIIDPQGCCVATESSMPIHVNPCESAFYNRQPTTDNRQPTTDNQHFWLVKPQLWWPAGYGAQPLYTCRVELVSDDGEILDTRETTFGIRTVEVRQDPDRPESPEAALTRQLRQRFPKEDRNGDRPGSGFKLYVNGIEIFCKGGNWVPADPFPARITPDWYERLIKLAADGNQNMLRTWGGGIYEPEPFWDACNRHGVMVCQDFMTACAQYPEDDPEFMAAMQAEVPVVIRRLRNHPSLVWWYGDNENGYKFSEDDPACWGRRLVEEIIAPALRELDSSRPFFPTSPFGGNLNSSLTIGDCHVAYTPSREEDYQNGLREYREKIEEVTGRFLSETQSYGAPARTSLLKFMTDEDIADPDNRILEFHSKTNPYASMTLIAGQLRRAELLFGQPNSARQKTAFLEYLQYEWVRLIVEHLRRQRFYCGGALFWMYNDCWPANGWSLVDYYGQPKAAWYAMKQACAPVSASIHDTGDTFEVWGCNDSLEPVSARARLYVQPWHGTQRWEKILDQVNLPANASVKIAEIAKPAIVGLDKDAVLVCDLLPPIQSAEPATPDLNQTPSTKHDEQRTKNEEPAPLRAWYYPGLPREITPPPARLNVTCQPGNKLTIAADSYARVVTLEADSLVFSDNYFELLPGDSKTVEITANAEPGTELTVSCWNMAGTPTTVRI